jgi:uncharacterized membrane protein (DUF485 family)
MEIFQMSIFVHYLLLTLIFFSFLFCIKHSYSWNRSVISLHVYFFIAILHSFNKRKLSCCILSSESFTWCLWFSMMFDIVFMLVVCVLVFLYDLSHTTDTCLSKFSLKVVFSELASGAGSASVWCKIVLKRKQSQPICLVLFKQYLELYETWGFHGSKVKVKGKVIPVLN